LKGDAAQTSVPVQWDMPGVAWSRATRKELARLWPAGESESWLSNGEREVYAEFVNPGLGEGWLFGRLLAKQLVLDQVGVASSIGFEVQRPAAIEIHSRDGLGRRVSPRIIVDGRQLGCSLSIAHSCDGVMVALSSEPEVTVGVDLASPAIPKQGFIDLWLTPWEQQWVRGLPVSSASLRVAQLWAIKEAYYKASNRGEPFVPGAIEVRFDENGPVVWPDGKAELRTCRICLRQFETEVGAIVTLEEAGRNIL
jgi:hypothetical protein